MNGLSYGKMSKMPKLIHATISRHCSAIDGM